MVKATYKLKGSQEEEVAESLQVSASSVADLIIALVQYARLCLTAANFDPLLHKLQWSYHIVKNKLEEGEDKREIS
ncbi:hypothetical protein E2C01_046104 [Portunus trituberculatus]|uniref:Uncharacterized protein n=1 Tax=Portunus trituberculatus TaxID=210409 RepID=A0A5B7G028_PORTR|nr:hypothetical protein [Portunus trituberculatus]